MATTQIKDYSNDNQAHVDATGHVYVTDGGQPIAVTGTVIATNASVGLNGAPAPTSSTEVGGIDPSGNLEGLKVDNTGALIVTSGAASPLNVVSNYNEVTSVASGVETSLVTYTAPVGKLSYLQLILSGGQNMAEYRIYNNASVIDKQYSSLTQFNTNFDYRSDNNGFPGILIAVGNVIAVKVLQSRLTSANFNARIQVIEVG